MMSDRSCWDVHLFASPAQHDILCVCCGKVCRDAVRSRACSHIAGMGCILEHLVKAENCPKCFVPLDCTMLEPSEVIRSFVANATVRCPTGPANCEWSGPLSQMPAHVHSDACGVPRVQCPFCRRTFDAKEFEDSHKAECPEALVLCGGCNNAVERRLLEEHTAECKAAREAEEQAAAAAAAAAAAKKKKAAAPAGGRRGASAVRGGSSSVAAARRGSVSQTARSQSAMGPRSASKKDAAAAVAAGAGAGAGEPSSTARPASSAVRTGVVQPKRGLDASPAVNSALDLSIRSPSRKLLGDDSSMMMMMHPTGGALNPAHLSPSQLAQQRTMSTLNNSLATTSQSQSQIIQHPSQYQQQQQMMMNGALSPAPAHTVVIPPDFGSISSLCQEMSRLGQRCVDLESQLDDLRRSDAQKESMINVMTSQMKRMEEQLKSLEQNQTQAAAKRQVDEGIAVRPISPPPGVAGAARAAAAAKKSSAAAAGSSSAAAAAAHDPAYQMRNKGYRGASQKDGDNGEVQFSLPRDVKKQITRESKADDIQQLMKRETALRKKLEDGKGSAAAAAAAAAAAKK